MGYFRVDRNTRRVLINNCCKDPLQELFLNAYETRKEGSVMGTLHTFPYSDPALIPESARLIRRISVPNCFGNFPIAPFIGLEVPAPAPETGYRSPPGLSQRAERMALEGHVESRFRKLAPLSVMPVDTHVSIGVGFYWWMKDEAGREFFGYPIDPGVPANRMPISRPRILRALHALRQLPIIDVCHEANPLALCWAVARKEVEPRRVEKMIDLFGHDVVHELRARLREYRPSAKELGMLKGFLYKGHIRSLRFE